MALHLIIINVMLIGTHEYKRNVNSHVGFMFGLKA